MFAVSSISFSTLCSGRVSATGRRALLLAWRVAFQYPVFGSSVCNRSRLGPRHLRMALYLTFRGPTILLTPVFHPLSPTLAPLTSSPFRKPFSVPKPLPFATLTTRLYTSLQKRRNSQVTQRARLRGGPGIASRSTISRMARSWPTTSRRSAGVMATS